MNNPFASRVGRGFYALVLLLFIIELTLVKCYTFYQIIFFRRTEKLDKMSMNPCSHYSFADTVYTLNVTPV